MKQFCNFHSEAASGFALLPPLDYRAFSESPIARFHE
jgi:hypothetical protein